MDIKNIKTGFGSQFRKEKRAERRQEIYIKIMYFILALTIIWSVYSLDIIINRAIDLM